jgi:MYXO-CTERM domain-containing protein
MQKIIGIVALVAISGSAVGQSLITAGPSAQGTGGYAARATYQLDDGTAENSVGLTGGGYIVASNQFTVAGGNNVLTSLEVTWGSPVFPGTSGVNAGDPFDIFIWADTGAGPQAGTLLYQGVGFADAGAVDNNVFQVVGLPNVVVPGAGFLIGVGKLHVGGNFPMATDLNVQLPGRSWASGGPGFDPNTAPGFAGGPALDLQAIGLGNWMIRANAVPAPGAMALVGLGGLLVARRRR